MTMLLPSWSNRASRLLPYFSIGTRRLLFSMSMVLGAIARLSMTFSIMLHSSFSGMIIWLMSGL